MPRGLDGGRHNASINTRFSPGTKNSSATQGLAPASTARRIVMLTPIHRNGSAMTAMRGKSHAGAPRSNACRVVSKGER